MNKEPLLSICIPTYNRSIYLKKTLESIVVQKRFFETNEIEIIISDNCSNDNTEEVANEFVEHYGEKIRYFRNEVNVFDANMELCLSRGKGMFLKLNNDTLKHLPNTLDIMVETIKANVDTKKILFFFNKMIVTKETKNDFFVKKDLNEFICTISYYCTWIGAFGIWKKDFVSLNNFSRYAKLLLTQTDVLFRTIGSNREVYINNSLLFETLDLAKKGGYDVITVFLDNYTKILKEFLDKGDITYNTYNLETKKLLVNYLPLTLARLKIHPDKYYFEAKNKFSRLLNFYRDRPLIFAEFILKYNFWKVKLLAKKIIGKE